LAGQIGSGASTPILPKLTDKAGQTSATPGGGGGQGTGGKGFHHSFGLHQRDFRDELRNSFHRPKLNFSRYDGETDSLPWLNRCESYFMGMQTMPAEQVWLASLHLYGAAAEWYYALEREYGMLPWTHFAKFLKLHFGPPIRFNLLGELKALQRIGTVEEY
jgi:hypothetical protein